MSIAIDYTIGKNPDMLREVFGMQVAIFNWLKAFFRYGTQEKIYFLIDDVTAWHEVQNLAKETGLDPDRLVAFDRRFVQQNYQQFTTIFRPDPTAQDILWRRETLPGDGYTFCGLAHAISGLETGVLLEQYCLAPTTATDAIVAPSHAVQASIRSFLDMYSDYIRQRFNCDYQCPIQLPVIPLGIDVPKFEARSTPDKRVDQRAKLGIANDEIILLWVGRLSHAIKAHPLSMFQAAERAAEITGAKVHLVMQGYFVPETDEAHFKNLAADICIKSNAVFVPNLDERFPDGLWAAGDIFISLIDNMQESFGLTPIEAMAAGLPRVISDWDGYRDGVQHGVDGFLVPTYQPPPGTGDALSELLRSGRDAYGGYLAKTALSVAVDQEAAAQFIATLIRDPNLRRSMGTKGRERARATYEWKHIIPRYEAFWRETAAQRQRDMTNLKRIKWASLPPQAPDPFAMYAAYPTAAFKPIDKIAVIASTEQIQRLWKHEVNVFGLDVMVAPTEIMQLVNRLRTSGETTIGAVLQQNANLDSSALWRTLAWMIKLGIVGHHPV